MTLISWWLIEVIKGSISKCWFVGHHEPSCLCWFSTAPPLSCPSPKTCVGSLICSGHWSERFPPIINPVWLHVSFLKRQSETEKVCFRLWSTWQIPFYQPAHSISSSGPSATRAHTVVGSFRVTAFGRWEGRFENETLRWPQHSLFSLRVRSSEMFKSEMISCSGGCAAGRTF